MDIKYGRANVIAIPTFVVHEHHKLIEMIRVLQRSRKHK